MIDNIICNNCYKFILQECLDTNNLRGNICFYWFMLYYSYVTLLGPVPNPTINEINHELKQINK